MKQPIGPALPGIRTVLLAFGGADVRPRDVVERVSGRPTRHVQSFCESVMLPFLPKGLLLWGATGDTFVHTIKVGNVTEAEVGGVAPIPGLYFEQGRSFDDIARLAEAGELDLALDARLQLEMREASPGMMITVALSGPFDRFCLWGSTYTDGRPYRRASVAALESNAHVFSGRVDEIGLAGVRTVLDVTAPDAATAAALLVGLQAQHSARY